MTLDVPLAMYVCCPSDVAAGLIFFGCIAMLRVLSGVLEAVNMFLSMELRLCSILVFPLTCFFFETMSACYSVQKGHIWTKPSPET
jgi:hypothetical protein